LTIIPVLFLLFGGGPGNHDGGMVSSTKGGGPSKQALLIHVLALDSTSLLMDKISGRNLGFARGEIGM
jgi:hypothetical protein